MQALLEKAAANGKQDPELIRELSKRRAAVQETAALAKELNAAAKTSEDVDAMQALLEKATANGKQDPELISELSKRRAAVQETAALAKELNAAAKTSEDVGSFSFFIQADQPRRFSLSSNSVVNSFVPRRFSVSSNASAESQEQEDEDLEHDDCNGFTLQLPAANRASESKLSVASCGPDHLGADGHGQTSAHFNMDVTAGGIINDLDSNAPVGKGGRASVGFAVAKPGEKMLGDNLKYSELAEVVDKGERLLEMTFQKNDLASVTLRIKTENSVDHDTLLNNLKDNCDLEKTWIHKYDPTCKSSFSNLKHHFAHGGPLGKLHAVLEFLVDFVLSSTLCWCDVKDATKEGRWIACFCGAMFWLAFFSWLMVQVMTHISENIAVLSPMLLGVTIGAIGTSLPNAMGSIIMAKQGKSAAAIGNAFGSNVQNVFLAMAGPWMIYLCAAPGNVVVNSLDAKGQTVAEGVNWMLGTLVFVVFLAIIPQTCTLSKVYGYILLAVYVGYLSWTIFEFLSIKN